MPVQLFVTTEDSDKSPLLPRGAALSSPFPPLTPHAEEKSLENSRQTQPERRSSSLSITPVDSNTTKKSATLPDQTLEFPDDLEFCRDPTGRRVEFGRGAWSIVYKATSREPKDAPLITPPSSPASGSQVLAVKSPFRRDAYPILHAEAQILTRVNREPGSDSYVVPFQGYITSSNSIVMSAIPLLLSAHIEDSATVAKEQMSTKTMFDPILGMESWQDLATKLISGLSWLHNKAQIVHGDIKPHNILLRPCSTVDNESSKFPYEPLFADFSSSHDLSRPSADRKTAMTAFTPPFTAPELLLLPSITSPDITPLPASDIFSLAITLLSAATGDLFLYPGSNNMQRLAMAREGHRVLEFIRSGSNACRVPRNGTVEQVVKPAITKDPVQRVAADEWLHVVRNIG
ncbi:Protein kinase domain-containing protein [Aspergillus sclerotialis]|uniref:Protein kinase domain-containing protein n=1 Tax=Aspergillus sclerotialis TaxID=2070753 RepID=A0A3A2ZIQ8_9EURO|nr:Protein kinase domain-containing protein [Aspergillus sclerotialis]